MNILIVEDDENKRTQIVQFLQQEYPGCVFRVERSLQSGLRHIRSSSPDLVLLDMTLPNYDAGPDESGGQTHKLGGREFLRQMDRFDILAPVIVVTQFETFGKGEKAIDLATLDRDLRRDHSAVYRGAVYYHAARDGWKQDLKNSIQKLLLGRS
jgi:CheY-like chemotaxis protein